MLSSFTIAEAEDYDRRSRHDRWKRVYEEATDSGGGCVLVDRLWPHGIGRTRLGLNAWLRDLAPSNELRRWFRAHSAERGEFRKRHLGELKAAATACEQLHELLDTSSRVTLLFASKNAEYNNAKVLKELIGGKSLNARKPQRHGKEALKDPI